MNHTLSILIVDDHPAMCQTLQDILAEPLNLDNLFAILDTIKPQLYSDFLEKPGGSP